MYQILPGDQV